MNPDYDTVLTSSHLLFATKNIWKYFSTLLSGEELPAGTQRLTIDGSRLPAGIYMQSVTANDERTARRVVRMQ
jgi:hypothetical protein